MVELKKQINQLAQQAGREPPYDLEFLHAGPLRNKGHEHNA
jgi:hypothetical protein